MTTSKNDRLLTEYVW